MMSDMVDPQTQERLDRAVEGMRQALREGDCSAGDLRRKAREIVGTSDLESVAFWELLNARDVEIVRGDTVHLTGSAEPAVAG